MIALSKLASWSCFGALIVLFVAWCLLRIASITEDEMDFEENQELITEEVRWQAQHRPVEARARDYLLWEGELRDCEEAE